MRSAARIGRRIYQSLNPLFIRSSIPLCGSKNDLNRPRKASQSLIHQVIYSVRCEINASPEFKFLGSQSLIHQVIYSVTMGSQKGPFMRIKSLNPLFIRSSIPLSARATYGRRFLRSQSLIHQVIYSVLLRPLCGCKMIMAGSQSLIHQVIYSVARTIEGPDEEGRAGLNPLFIRSSIPFLPGKKGYEMSATPVSIPYSSGHLFRSGCRNFAGTATRDVSIPYSSGHLFRFEGSRLGTTEPRSSVSIPYSSGHLFRSESARATYGRRFLRLNPLFIRSSIPLIRR